MRNLYFLIVCLNWGLKGIAVRVREARECIGCDGVAVALSIDCRCTRTIRDCTTELWQWK